MPSSILNSDDGVISGTAGLKNSGGDDAVLLIQTKGVTAQTVDAGQRTMFPTTISVGGATPSTSGSGISFPASASASTDANTLDDYEEGTWTPTVIGTTTAGVGTYSKQVGRYIKIGKLVLVQAQIQWSAHTGTGNLQTVLPFAVVSVNDAAFIPSIVTIDLTLTANNLAAGVFEAFSSSFNYYQMPTGGGAVTSISMDTSARVVWSGVYETN